MLSFRFALKNLIRNLKYTAGLFLVFFVASVLCGTFFLFTAAAEDVYQGILNKRASSAYVALSFGYDGTELFDLTSEQRARLDQIENVREIEKFAFNFGANYLSLNGGKRIEADISLIATQGQAIPQAYRTEFSAIYDDGIFVCGREAESLSECLVSEAFVSLTGAETAEELLGQTLKLTDGLGDAVIQEAVIVGVVRSGLSEVSAMEEKSKYFVFAGIDALERSAVGTYYYVLFSDYSHLTEIKESLEELSVENTSVSLGNDSYSMKKLAQVSDFISAVLVLISILCLAACIAVITGTALLKFARSRPFYYAAFSVGLSKGKLALSFLFEFLIVALAAFVLSVPVGIGLVGGLSRLTVIFVGISFSVKFNLPVVLYSLIPLVFATAVSTFAVRGRIIFEKE